MKDNKKREAYRVGAGISSLATAAYLIGEGRIPGKNIHILEESSETGGSMVEYSIRSAQAAVFSLLMLDKKVSPLYKGQHDINVLFHSVKTMLT